jgi:hypothetical protein
MPKITNNAPGPRGVTVIEEGHSKEKPLVRTEILAPGQTFEGDFLDDGKSFKARVESGEFSLGDARRQRRDEMSEEEEQEAREKEFGQSPTQVLNRQAAERAGRDPGLVETPIDAEGKPIEHTGPGGASGRSQGPGARPVARPVRAAPSKSRGKDDDE